MPNKQMLLDTLLHTKDSAPGPDGLHMLLGGFYLRSRLMPCFFFSIAFVTCFWYHGNRNGHSTSLGEKAKGDDAVIKKTLCFTMVKI